MAPQTAGRAFNYPVGVNLSYIPRGESSITFEQLRALADNLPMLRIVIEKRKDQIKGWDWDIQPTLAGKDKRRAGQAVASASDPRVDYVRDFLRRPDRRLSFHTWLGKIVEDMLVVDAACVYPRMTNGGDLFSLDVVDGACYSDDTEVLTRTGWKAFSAVNIETDEFATRNINTKAFEWQKATYFHEADYVGPMHRFHSRAVDILVSPNHRMLVTSLPRMLGGSRHRYGEAVVKAADLATSLTGRTQIPMTSQWEGVEIGEKRFATDDPRSARTVMSGDDYCAFMGAYLAEGSGNSESVYISQSPTGKGFSPFKALLDRIGGRPVLHTGTNFIISRRALRRHVAQFGTSLTKFIPDEIMNASPRQLAIFWQYFWLGDGSAERNRVYTSSPRMADQLVEIAQKLGKSASVNARAHTKTLKFADGRTIEPENCSTSYVVSVRNTKAMTVQHSEEMYAGKIRCVSVPNEFLYVRRNGKPAWCGNTIKVLIGEDGRVPLPEEGPAYQQILHGVPASDFALDELLYLPRNLRSNRLYGFSPVEQIILTINIALRREFMSLDYYNAGTIPDGFGTLPKEWTVDQIKSFQDWFDALMSGNLEQRRKLRFMPEGFKYSEVRQPPLKDMYDEWLWRIICAAFGVSPSGVVADVNRATAQTLQVQASHEGIGPLKAWVKEFFDDVVQRLMGFRDLEFRWQGEDDVDPLEQAQSLQILTSAGIKTVDEARVELGLGPMTAADKAALAAQNQQGQNDDAGAQGGQPQAKGDEGVGKAATIPFRPLAALSLDRATLHQPRAAMEAAWKAILARHAQVARDAITATLSEVAKAEDTPDDPASEDERGAWSDERIALEVERVVEQLELDLSDAVMSSVVSPMAQVARDAGLRAVAQALNVGVLLGDDPNAGAEPGREIVGGDIFDKINTRAVAWAQEHAAELVSGVNDVTRDAVRGAVAEGLAAGERYTDIIARVESLKAFSDDRAALIAETEIANANSNGALKGLFQARDAGVNVKKAWLVAFERVCPICLANQAAGPIELEARFPSGDLAPAAHPRCRCALIPQIQEDTAKIARSRFACN